MDTTDLQIMCLLGENGRISNREIARRIGVAEGTVRQRLSALIGSGALRISAQFNIESFPEAYIAVVGMKIDGRRLTECASEVERLPSVITTMIVTGRHDLLAFVLAVSRETLVDFVTGHLATLPGVKDSETFVVLRSYGQWIPADKLSAILGATVSTGRGASPTAKTRRGRKRRNADPAKNTSE
jgi:Lrp/AsnC family transcriptional regulator, regulator for asnA, asnC and gidA